MREQLTVITSHSNPRLKLVRYLSDSSAIRKKGLFLIEGPRFVSDYMIRVGLRPSFVVVSEDGTKDACSIAMTAADQGVEVLQVSGELFRDLSDTEHGQGIIAVCPLPENELGNVITGNTVLMLDGVSDPGNVGTVIRSAAAFGCGGVVCGKGTCFPFLPRVSRSAAGWNASIPIVYGVRLEIAAQSLRGSGYRILGTDPDGKSVHDLPLQSTPVALVIGSETRGISPGVKEILEEVVSIPMEGLVESLNAGVSASILLYCLTRNQSISSK